MHRSWGVGLRRFSIVTKAPIFIAPLTPRTGITSPPNLIHSFGGAAKIVSNFDIPDIVKSRNRRRAEYGNPQNGDKHSRDVRQNKLHQESLYKFALVDCLGLDNLGNCVLDLACGNLLPFGGINFGNRRLPYLIGLDKMTQLVGSAADFASCSLVGSRFPVRASTVDTIVSISFLQWVTVSGDSGLIGGFADECVRILSQDSGQAIFQFYPSCTDELNYVCETLAAAHSQIRGCRLSARPVDNRGIKIYVYFVKI